MVFYLSLKHEMTKDDQIPSDPDNEGNRYLIPGSRPWQSSTLRILQEWRRICFL